MASIGVVVAGGECPSGEHVVGVGDDGHADRGQQQRAQIAHRHIRHLTARAVPRGCRRRPRCRAPRGRRRRRPRWRAACRSAAPARAGTAGWPTSRNSEHGPAERQRRSVQFVQAPRRTTGPRHERIAVHRDAGQLLELAHDHDARRRRPCTRRAPAWTTGRRGSRAAPAHADDAHRRPRRWPSAAASAA